MTVWKGPGAIRIWQNLLCFGIMCLQCHCSVIPFRDFSLRVAKMQPRALGTEDKATVSVIQHCFEQSHGYNILANSSWAHKKLWVTELTAVTGWYWTPALKAGLSSHKIVIVCYTQRHDSRDRGQLRYEPGGPATWLGQADFILFSSPSQKDC